MNATEWWPRFRIVPVQPADLALAHAGVDERREQRVATGADLADRFQQAADILRALDRRGEPPLLSEPDPKSFVANGTAMQVAE